VLRSQSEDEDDRGKRNRVSQATLLVDKYDSSKMCSIFKRLRRELKVWQRLNHDNVLPLYGTTSDFGPYSSMVCPWVDNGSLSKYLERRGATLTLRERFGIVSGRCFVNCP
jgi:serine/threonine protein kinase